MTQSQGGAARDELWPAGSFLAALSDPLRTELMKLGVVTAYPRGRTILSQGDSGDLVLLLLGGVVKIFLISGEGDELLLALRSRGDVIGEMAFITGEPRSARVVAATEVNARVVKPADFRAFLDRWTAAHAQLTATVIRKLHRANDRRAEFRFHTTAGRLALALSDAAEAVGSRADGGLALGSEVTQADLAALASISTSAVEKALREWEIAGLVVRRRQVLIVTDPQALRALAETERRNPYGEG
jgi:CRP/FNR family cyclic AMP-dependent transcriptional regulator